MGPRAVYGKPMSAARHGRQAQAHRGPRQPDQQYRFGLCITLEYVTLAMLSHAKTVLI